jgi:enamine deaminase RidA (YjgF/YER057c/UK114 family)
MLKVSDGGDLLLVSWTGGGGAKPTTEQAAEAYASMDRVLREHDAALLQERVFADLQSMPCVARGRARAVVADDTWRVPPTCVEGAPVGRSGLAGIHVVAARRSGGTARVVSEKGRVYGRVVETASARVAGLADVGRAAAGRLATGPTEEAGVAIECADRLLAGEGFSFRDVARTWFFLRDILDWYGPFNAVRNSAFRRMGLMGANGDRTIPASTGIAGRNARGGWCTLDLVAVQPRPGGRFEMRRLHGRRQNEATEYGSAFARGMALTLGEWRYVLVSGTASIDDRGATVHVGDFDRQTRQTLDAVASVLEEGGASLSDLDQATAFLKNPCDGRAFDRIAERTGLGRAPLVTVEADVCRDDLLFEIDATAVVPLKRDGAKKR